MGHAAVAKLTAKGRATREHIVRVASELMLERGVARTTIEDIQDAANVSTSQMYHYFGDKGDLVAAVIDLQSSQVLGRQQLASSRSTASPRWSGGGMPSSTSCAVVGASGLPNRVVGQRAVGYRPAGQGPFGPGVRAVGGHHPRGADSDRRTGRTAGRVRGDRLAMAVLAGVQGGLLLSQLRRDTEPLEAALDTMIEHLRCMGVR